MLTKQSGYVIILQMIQNEKSINDKGYIYIFGWRM